MSPSDQFMSGVGLAVVLALVFGATFWLAGVTRCQQLTKQAQHAGKADIAEWIKTSEACN